MPGQAEATNDVLIVGAGVAGLAAAVALSGAGAGVKLLERKPYVGGRAYSYPHPALGEVIDSQHVLLGCCTNLIDFCRLCGADQHIRWYDDITFLEPGNALHAAQRSVIGPGWLPAPAHSAWSFLRAPMLSLHDKTRIGLGLARFLRGYPMQDGEAFSEWLRRTGQTPRAIRHFWEPVVVGALNDSFENCSTKYAAQVFYESFLKSAQGGRLGIPTQPMTEFYSAAARLAESQGAVVALRQSVETLERSGNGWLARCSDGTVHSASAVILALPFEQTAKLLASLPENEPARQDIEPALPRFQHAPITTLHLWFDRPVTHLDHAALLDTRIQWMFNKTQIRQDTSAAGQYLELVISASFEELKKSREDILRDGLAELQSFFPLVGNATLLKSGVLKEARATFSVFPGLDVFRPAAETRSAGLFLAGDWTQTGWPSTMEGAVRSGRLAAGGVQAGKGPSGLFLVSESK